MRCGRQAWLDYETDTVLGSNCVVQQHRLRSPWDHPINRSYFGLHFSNLCLPNQPLHYTTEGYGITGYHANQALMYRGSQVTFADVTDGLSNVLMFGEITGNATPFGYPFNWRDPKRPLCQSPDSFGAWSDGAYFVAGDGSIKFLSKQTMRPRYKNWLGKSCLMAQRIQPSSDRIVSLI